MRWLTSPSPILLAYAAALLLFVLVSLYSPGFANPAHVATLITLAAFTGIVAIGQTTVIIGGGIDLSVPLILNSAAILVTGLAHEQNWPLLWIVPLILVLGCLVGIVNGIGIALLRVPAIVMTMSVNVITQGLLLIVTRGFPPPLAPPALTFVAAGKLGPVPVILLLWYRAPHRFRPLSLRAGLQSHRRDAVGRTGGANHYHRLCRQRHDGRARRCPPQRL